MFRNVEIKLYIREREIERVREGEVNRRIDSLETKRTFILNGTRLDFDDTKHWKTGDSIGPCETFDSSRKRNIFIRFIFSLICAIVHSHVTCTPVETIIGRT